MKSIPHAISEKCLIVQKMWGQYIAAHFNSFLSLIVKETINKHGFGLDKENAVSNCKTNVLHSLRHAVWPLAT